MAWYWWLLIVVGIIIVWSVLSSKSRESDRVLRRKKFLEDISTWKVGDELSMTEYWMDKSKENGLKYPKLYKWDSKEVLIDCGENNSVYVVKHSAVRENRTDTWRNRHARMDKFMSGINQIAKFKPKKKNNKGENVEVESKMEVKIKGGEIWIDGKPLMGMPEIYLKIYAGYAQEEENFNLLAKIREELKKHR